MKVANCTKLEAKSPSRKVLRNCGIRTSFRLLDMPQNANSATMSTVAPRNPGVIRVVCSFAVPPVSLMASHPSWQISVDYVVRNLLGRGAHVFGGLAHVHEQRRAVHERNGERRHG